MPGSLNKRCVLTSEYTVTIAFSEKLVPATDSQEFIFNYFGLQQYLTGITKLFNYNRRNKSAKALQNKLLYLGKDYPLGYEFFRDKCKKAFLANRHETDPKKIKRMIAYGNYLISELEALYKIKKYRTLKKRYYHEGHEDYNEIFKKLNQQSMEGKFCRN